MFFNYLFCTYKLQLFLYSVPLQENAREKGERDYGNF
jgi:hypothetical protein